MAKRRHTQARGRGRLRGPARPGAVASLIELLLIALILLVVAAFVTSPLRGPRDGGRDRAEDPVVAELEARKEAKYREIRDAEMDHAAGKLTREEWRRIDRELRREAIALLKELDRIQAESSDIRHQSSGRGPTADD